MKIKFSLWKFLGKLCLILAAAGIVMLLALGLFYGKDLDSVSRNEKIYEYITRLDAEETEKIWELDAEKFYINGAEKRKEEISIQTDADSVIQFLNLKYGEKYPQWKAKHSIRQIHKSLYDVSCEERMAHITALEFEAYVMDSDVAARWESRVNPYGTLETLKNPLGTRPYGVAERFGWYYDGSLHKRDGITISAPAGTPVYSVMTGTVTSTHDTTVTMGGTKESAYYEVTIDGILPEIEPGAVQCGDQIAVVAADGSLKISITIGGIPVNPTFLLQGWEK